ncbi:hypothetical protein N8T08_005811 [Aspergillus melleus]|uniref:Uncharacterized protein n=1 Tax=Aspergillus melleus TaxID=138277 RepID=A0ACC3B1E9_9EURO|nr:hypothetical protein N8T08_005811 [Aspergillus melleus]
MSDHNRMGMWWLTHLYFFARLINGKPVAFSSQLHDWRVNIWRVNIWRVNIWRVNMPRLAAGSSQERNEAVSTVAFLARSRLTFILINYFQESESLNNRSDLLTAINPLYDDVEDIFEQWKIDEWLESCRGGDINGWILGELVLSGYTSILFMLRKASSVPEMTDRRSMLSENNGMIPRSDLSMRTSRRILKLVHHMIYILKLPGPEAMSLILGNYRAYIAHAHLASGLMQEPTAPTTEDDLLLLWDVAKCIEGLAREVNEFVPLARAFMMVNDEVRRRVQGNHEAIERLVEAF